MIELFCYLILGIGVLWTGLLIVVGVGLIQPGRSMQDVWREREKT
jgi:hypothetical protein